jgi:HK97 family phage prohead protease
MKLKTKKIKRLNIKTLIEGEKKVLMIKGLHGVKAVDGAEEGTIEAYVSIFGNIDSYGDIVEPGAFKDSLAKWFPRYPKGIWAHDWSLPIAETLEAKEDARGLYIKGKLLLTVEKGKEAWELIKSGVVTDFSFGYEVNEYEYDTLGYRHLKKLTIYEWSPVLVGANNQATILSMKSAVKELTDEDIEEEEVDIPEDVPEAGEVKPIPEVQPVSTEPTEEEKAKALADAEVKAGRVLSAKNVEIVKGAISGIDSAMTGLSDAKTAFEALLKAVEEPASGDDGKGKGVDQPISKAEVKNVLRGVRRVVNEGQKTIITLKKITQ